MPERIVQVIVQYPSGATIEQVGQVIDVRRTLQRRLAELVTNGRVRAIGHGKQRRYQLASHDGERLDELPASRAGQRVRSLVRRPLNRRTPVGYVTSLEGNTYSRLDTQNLIELGRQAPGKDQREAQMILNHKAAIEMLVENI